MENERSLVAFEEHKIRRFFDEQNEAWYFSVIDVVAALTESVNPRDYWFKMKIRVKTDTEAGKKGGGIAQKARRELEQKTGKNVVTEENFLPPSKHKKILKGNSDER